jgi:hypothetical protein
MVIKSPAALDSTLNCICTMIQHPLEIEALRSENDANLLIGLQRLLLDRQAYIPIDDIPEVFHGDIEVNWDAVLLVAKVMHRIPCASLESFLDGAENLNDG